MNLCQSLHGRLQTFVTSKHVSHLRANRWNPVALRRTAAGQTLCLRRTKGLGIRLRVRRELDASVTHLAASRVVSSAQAASDSSARSTYRSTWSIRD